MAFETESLALPQTSGKATRRAEMFRESARDRLERWALGAVWAVRPPRHKALPALAKLWLTDLMAPDYALPDPEADLHDGLAGIVHDLSMPTLLAASRRGLYPFAHIAPLKWWSPAQRSLLFFRDFHISKRMRAYIRKARYRVTFDRDFDGVLKACAGRRPGKWHLTWITPRIMRTYAEAFDSGFAHSFEVWNEAGELAGGGYGLSIGGCFLIESQFARESNSSKIGFSLLNWHLAKWGYMFADNKRQTPTVEEMGFREVPRANFLKLLAEADRLPGKIGRWQVETDLATVAEWNIADQRVNNAA